MLIEIGVKNTALCALRGRKCLSSSDKRDQKQYYKYDKENARDACCFSGYSSKSENGSDKSYHQKSK
jgi:hypothetical protein